MTSANDMAKSLGIDFSPSSIVELHEKNLRFLANHIRSSNRFESFHPYGWDDNNFWNAKDEPKLRSQFFCVGNSINFRFRDIVEGKRVAFEGIRGGISAKGSMYMWRCLRETLQEGNIPILDAGFLSSITSSEVNQIFRSDNGDTPIIPGIEDRVKNLRDLGEKLRINWGGLFYNLVLNSAGSLIKFAKYSRQMRAFDDPVYKLTMVNAILHVGNGLCVFEENILPGIDYHLLKQLLRMGVLIPQHDVDSCLKNKKFLSVKEAYELRRIALKALMLLSDMTGLSGDLLDNKLWLNRQNCAEIDPVCTSSDDSAKCPFLGVCSQNIEYGSPMSATRYF